MKVKRYILVVTLALTIGFSYAGAAFACDCGGPPPDTASIQIECPAI
ncbi:MAG: hypothetical protein JSW26_28655 [Desulfobacterales bacterium]|nr:MAG: hypothetical protein JSW26_28655 [Desulfobacterales bacterium]